LSTNWRNSAALLANIMPAVATLSLDKMSEDALPLKERSSPFVTTVGVLIATDMAQSCGQVSSPGPMGWLVWLDGSYSGGTQYLLAPTQPAFLKALFVREGMSDIYYDLAFRGGAYQLALHRGWAINATFAHLQQDTAPNMAPALFAFELAAKQKEHWYRHLPLLSCPPLDGLAEPR
jgi:Predicted acyl esterases